MKLSPVIPGAGIDRLIGDVLVEAVSPITLEVALTVQQELQSRLDEADRLRHQQVKRARYEADLAQRRYMKVDPDNRLVADTLEADWNQKLRALSEAQNEYERRREQDRKLLTEEQRAAILSLATDFPRLWRNPAFIQVSVPQAVQGVQRADRGLVRSGNRGVEHRSFCGHALAVALCYYNV